MFISDLLKQHFVDLQMTTVPATVCILYNFIIYKCVRVLLCVTSLRVQLSNYFHNR